MLDLGKSGVKGRMVVACWLSLLESEAVDDRVVIFPQRVEFVGLGDETHHGRLLLADHRDAKHAILLIILGEIGDDPRRRLAADLHFDDARVIDREIGVHFLDVAAEIIFGPFHGRRLRRSGIVTGILQGCLHPEGGR